MLVKINLYISYMHTLQVYVYKLYLYNLQVFAVEILMFISVLILERPTFQFERLTENVSWQLSIM